MRTIVTAFLLLLGVFAHADRVYATVQWPGWTISTTDVIPYDQELAKYPIENMIDGDLSTAWVYSKPIPQDDQEIDPYQVDGSSYALMIKPDRAIRMDGIRLMNGYNKSESVFKRNNRIVKVDIYENDYLSEYRARKIKSVTLSDKMGWHSISLPARKYKGLVLIVRGQVEGRDRDTCISEIEITSGGKALDWNRSKAYLRNNGDDCGCGSSWSVVSGGKVVAKTQEMSDPSISPDRRHVVGLSDKQAWVVDLRMGRIVQRWNLAENDEGELLGWIDNRTIGFVDLSTDKIEPKFRLK